MEPVSTVVKTREFYQCISGCGELRIPMSFEGQEGRIATGHVKIYPDHVVQLIAARTTVENFILKTVEHEGHV